MWPFGRWRERARLRAAFSGYLSKEALDRIQKGSTASLSMIPKQSSICFVLLHVRDDSPNQAHAHLSTAIDTIVDCGGVADLMCSCVLAIFGHPIGAGPDKTRIQRDVSISRLVAALGKNVRLIYGDTDGLVGNIGSRQRVHYGSLIPDFPRYLATLVALEFGQAVQI